MRIRRPDRVLAGLLLTALAAVLALLAQPSSAASLDGYDVRASVRYGCPQNDGEDGFVEVTLRADHWKGGDQELMLQVGLAGPDSADSGGIFPEGGPSLVTLSDTPTKVRLAGPVHDGDHVFLRQLDQPGVITLPLDGDCRRVKPTNFGLDEPTVQVAAPNCTSESRASLQVTLDNPNDVDPRLENLGIDQIDYTVLLVRHDGLLAGTDPVGTLISFDEPSASVITLSQVVAKPATYQVRVIGPDGAVVSSKNIRLSCAGTVPVPSSSLSPVRPTPTVPPSRPGSATPSTSRPAPSSSAPGSPAPSSPAPSSPAPSSPAPSRTAGSTAPATSAAASSAPAASRPPGPTTSAGPSSPVGSSTTPPAAGSSSPRVGPTTGSSTADRTPAASASSSSAVVPVASSPAPSPTPTSIRLVEPRSEYGALPVFQKDVALVVLVFSAAMAALVGGTVVAARRR